MVAYRAGRHLRCLSKNHKTLKKLLVAAVVVLAVTVWACSPEGGQSTETTQLSEQDIMATGAEITKAVGSSLVKTVRQKMGEGGVESALSYCRVNALPLTDSLSTAYNVRIKRTSLKTRNAANNPTGQEAELLAKLATQSEPQAGWVTTEEKTVMYYEPIMLKSFCQTCHGKVGESLTVATDSLIKVHYPLDKATQYAEGDLRGMWAVYFDE